MLNAMDVCTKEIAALRYVSYDAAAAELRTQRFAPLMLDGFSRLTLSCMLDYINDN